MASNKYASSADKDHAKVAAQKLRVSFEFLDLSQPHFFIHGLEADHYRKIFDCINEIADATEDQIAQQKHPSLEAKSIFNTATGEYKQFPEDIEISFAKKVAGPQPRIASKDRAEVKAAEEEYALILAQAKEQAQTMIKRAFEVRVGKAYGRIHGIVWNKVFYVVWFDPAHNLYPDSRRGGVKFHKDFMTVKSFSPEAVQDLRDIHMAHCEKLQADLDKLQKEHDELMAAFAAS